MSPMLQNPGNGESAWRLPTDLQQFKRLHVLPDDASPAATAPWPETSATRLRQWHITRHACTDKDQEFMDLLAAYRDSGGVARTHELLGMFRRGDGGNTEQLARWMVTRQVISIDWQDQTWFPWFQFDRAVGRPRSAVGQIARELDSVLGDWAIARWFVQPHAWLDESTPAHSLTSRPADVLEAARESRFLANG